MVLLTFSPNNILDTCAIRLLIFAFLKNKEKKRKEIEENHIIKLKFQIVAYKSVKCSDARSFSKHLSPIGKPLLLSEQIL